MDDRSARRLLERVERLVRPLGPADHLAVTELLGAGWAGSELGPAVASLLARNREEWATIRGLVEEHRPEGPLRPGGSGGGPGDRGRRGGSGGTGEPGGEEQGRSGWRRAMMAGAGIAACFVGMWLGGALLADRGAESPPAEIEVEAGLAPPPVDAPVSPEGSAPPVDVPVSPGGGALLADAPASPEGGAHAADLPVDLPSPPAVRFETVTPARAVGLARLAWDRLLVLLVVSGALLAAGLRLAVVEGSARRRELREQEQARLREVLEHRRLERTDEPIRLYHVATPPPLLTRSMQESAALLVRLRQSTSSRDIDVEPTLHRTLRAGGRPQIVWGARRSAARLLVLLDVEGGEHPWLWRLRGLLEVWERHGAGLEVWTFQRQPFDLRELASGRPIDLPRLVRHTEGLPCLLLSRRVEAVDDSAGGRFGEAAWLAASKGWGRRAWIDPDALARTRRDRRGHIAALEQRGWRRFALSDEGVVEAGSWLLHGRGQASPDPTPASDVEDALLLWAYAAAEVPEPHWEQLEVIRAEIPEIREHLPGPWAVARLIRWLELRGGAETADRLLLGPALVERLRDRFRERLAEVPELRRVQMAIGELLLRELVLPKGEEDGGIAWQWYQLQKARLRALLAPEEAQEHWKVVLTGPLAGEATRVLQAEAARQARSPIAGATWSPQGREELVGTGGEVTVGELLRGRWPARREVVGSLVAVGLMMGVAVGSGAQMVVPEVRRVVVEAYPETSARPAMLEVSAGTFQMGSPTTEDGRFTDEALHTVHITRPFLLAETEVSQAMWRAVMKTDPSVGEDQGVSLRGDDLPVQNVSWLQAVAYCNELSKLEALTEAYVIEGESVTWDPAADGYRLPTEAEWEYAARAGSGLAYGATGEAGEVCGVANVADAAALARFPGWTVFPCDDKVPGLATVRSFAANRWGFYGTQGNVAEWTWDWYTATLGNANDPTGPSSGSVRVIRGGSWRAPPAGARLACRRWMPPSFAYVDLGFRPARSSPSALLPSVPLPSGSP
jgi:formylglycine-generating enzyme required for sulfatase activity